MTTRTRTRTSELVAVGVLSALLASGGTYAVSLAGTDQAETSATETTEDPTGSGQESSGAADGTTVSLTGAQDWASVADHVSPSTVSIETRTNAGGGAGSGVIWDGAGHVVTNAHVVEGATKVRVTLSDGRGYAAEVQGVDAATDLAVLTLTGGPDDLTPIEVGDDADLTVGDPVMAVGNPLGLSGTVTTGIVSATDRPVSTQAAATEPGQEPSAVVTNAIQTSAAINPGNSGGALVDAAGRLIGINSSIASLSQSAMGGQAGNIGIGFAIPVGEVSSIVEQLIDSGQAEHAFLGVRLSNGEAAVDGATLTGAGIESVEAGSPAESAGLADDEVIVDIDGERVSSAEALVGQVRERTTGADVTLGVVRDGKREEVTVTLDTRPDDQG